MYPQTHQSPGVCDDDYSVIFDIMRVLISNVLLCALRGKHRRWTLHCTCRSLTTSTEKTNYNRKFAFRGGCLDEETGGQSTLGANSAANDGMCCCGQNLQPGLQLPCYLHTNQLPCPVLRKTERAFFLSSQVMKWQCKNVTLWKHFSGKLDNQTCELRWETIQKVSDEWGLPLTAHVQARGTQFKSYYDTQERGGPCYMEITISHNGENELPRSVWNTGWQKMLNTHNNNNNGSINNQTRADICCRYWDKTSKTAQADMICQRKEDISISFSFFPF